MDALRVPARAPAAIADRLDRISSRSPWFALVAVGVVIVVWPFGPHVSITLDHSFQIGLHQAAAEGLRFGSELAYTYGPLGFLAFPAPFLGPTSSLAFLATFAVFSAMMGVLLVSLRRLFPLWVAAPAVLLAARLMTELTGFEVLQLLVFSVGVMLLRRGPLDRPVPVAVFVGLAAAIGGLGKLNAGIVIALMGIAIALATPNVRRYLAVYLGTLAAAGLGLWFVTGQGVADLWLYARSAIDIIAGYNDALVSNIPAPMYVIPAFALEAIVMAWAAYLMARPWPRSRQLALAALVVLIVVAIWKGGMVRPHLPLAFGALGIAMVPLFSRAVPRSTVAIALALAGMVFFAVPPANRVLFQGVRTTVSHFVQGAADALLPFRWDEATARTQADQAAAFGVPPDIVTQLVGRTVHVDPWQAAVDTAHPVFQWSPVPVFQSFSAYTPYLDELNADALRSAQRPQRILRGIALHISDGQRGMARSTDGRFYWFESPAATVERLCRYRELAADGDWQVLADTGTQCGAWQPLGEVTAGLEELVPVPTAPSARDLVVVRVHGATLDPLRRLRAIALWAPRWWVDLDAVKYRLIPATAGDGLVLAVPEEAQGSPVFAFGPPVRSMSISRQGGGNLKLTYEFFAVPLAAP